MDFKKKSQPSVFKNFRRWSYTSDLIFKMVDQASHLKEARRSYHF